ncbi:alpha-L-glutamate ligase-like protein [Nitrosococcus wardiae]|uniref:Alpha-L-glutamate ligase-like protein n=1 Tax=Nitrosococcus wardiae TaxID=1814290 RepID=A0A4P7C475_9GAMM|nr:alpha-L-glutamate ligase-like protein [Nitrosococcus wardiae]QBQ55632.1 alpha-L-glutamate ligase-like protein [Nitrosococcus wardiae]
MILPWRRLRQLGILGMNQRNADYILPFNPRRHYPLVDDKRLTKQLALGAGIAVPQLYGLVDIVHQIRSLDKLLGPHEDFVIKPAHGSGGEGILVVTGRYKGRYRKASGIILTEEEIGHHIANILSGMYSLGGLPDTALIEYRVKFDPVFEAVSYLGVPDIRTLVFRGVPVLAMIRLPTRLSDGRANLHQGAIGVGIDLMTGRTSSGVWREQAIDHHPDTGGGIRGLEIPHWDAILELTARCFDLVGLGYIGVDIVLDRELGPLMLELNARPGLSIQLANKAGLRARLQRIQSLGEIPSAASERVALGKGLCNL